MNNGQVFYQPTSDCNYILDIRVNRVVTGVGSKKKVVNEEKYFLIPEVDFYMWKGKQYHRDTVRTTKDNLLKDIESGTFVPTEKSLDFV